MNLNNLTVEELELMSYTDVTYYLIKSEKKSMNTPVLFKKICELLEYSDEDFSNKIGDYYTSLTLDKRFILLDNNEWDLRDNHAVSLEIDEDEEVDEIEDDEEEDEEDEEEVIDDEDILDDDIEDDLEDLTIINEEDEEN